MPELVNQERDAPCEAVEVGRNAPDFELKTDADEVWRLSDHAEKVRVLLFYPQNETLVCTKQLCSVRDNWRQYIETKAEIVGISPSTPGEHREFSSRQKLPMPLLADSGRIATTLYAKHWFFPIQFTRAIVVIDANGIVRTRRIMLRAFRPNDDDVLTAIYSARGDALNDRFSKIRGNALKRFRK